MYCVKSRRRGPIEPLPPHQLFLFEAPKVKHNNKTDEIAELCVSILFEFEINCHYKSIFLKSDVNLVMFTSINICETLAIRTS